MYKLLITEEQKKIFDELREYGIYKHDEKFPLYKYVDIKTAILILKNSTVRFSTPKELNDNDFHLPFLNLTATEFERKEIMKTNISNWLEKNKQGTDYKHLKRLAKKEDFSSLDAKTFESLIHESKDVLREEYGILCLTKKKINKVMWNSYADGGKGVCLQYNIPRLFNDDFYTFCIKYVDKDELIHLFDNGKESITAIQKWMFVKEKRYEFENEVRAVSNLKGVIQINKEVFTGIYYGPNTSKRSITRIEWILGEHDYSFNKGIRLTSNDLE